MKGSEQDNRSCMEASKCERQKQKPTKRGAGPRLAATEGAAGLQGGPDAMRHRCCLNETYPMVSGAWIRDIKSVLALSVPVPAVVPPPVPAVGGGGLGTAAAVPAPELPAFGSGVALPCSPFPFFGTGSAVEPELFIVGMLALFIASTIWASKRG